jgi:hypothetical protein
MTSVKGNLEYVYRVNMDVGGGNFRDVDVHVKSDDMTYLGIDVSAAPPTAVATGRFYVRYIDTLTGQDYEQLDFGNGTFQLNVTDAGSGGLTDLFAIALRRPDGTLFHVSTAPYSHSSGSAAQVLLGGGNITIHS